MTIAVLLAILAAVILAALWPVNARRWGRDAVPPAARQWTEPDDEWNVGPQQLPSRVSAPATYWVGEPQVIEPPVRQIGAGG